MTSYLPPQLKYMIFHLLYLQNLLAELSKTNEVS